MPDRIGPARRIGLIVPTYNEVLCIAFALGPWFPYVDRVVVVDSGSTDGTLQLVRAIYAREIEAGKLIVEEMGHMPDYGFSIAKNRGLDILRAHDIDYFIRVDGDEVYYDSAALRLATYARTIEAPTLFYCRFLHLYQWQIEDDRSWLKALRQGTEAFYPINFPIGDQTTTVIYPVAGARAEGKFTDEATGLGAAGYHYAVDPPLQGSLEPVCAHYSWAKPLQIKRWKWNWLATYDSDLDASMRIDQLQRMENPPYSLGARFRAHPEIVARQIDAVRRWLDPERPRK